MFPCFTPLAAAQGAQSPSSGTFPPHPRGVSGPNPPARGAPRSCVRSSAAPLFDKKRLNCLTAFNFYCNEQRCVKVPSDQEPVHPASKETEMP